MKILYYSPHPHLNLRDLSGYGTHMREMIAAFRELGHEVLPVIAGGAEKTAAFSPVPPEKFSKKILKAILPSLVWESVKDMVLLEKDKQLEQLLLQQIDSFKPDLIYERANYLQLSGCQAAQKKGVKHFMEINAPYTEERKSLQGRSFFSNKAASAEREQVRSADKIIVVSSALENYFSQKYNTPAGKIIITPNAIKAEQIKTDQNEVSKIKTDYHLTGFTVIGFVGSIFPYHGIDILLKAFREVIGKVTACKLLIVGDGEMLSLLKQLSVDLGIDASVIFTGNISSDKVMNYISAMDICVMPDSNWYGSPVKIFEYGFLGKPIIAPDYIPLKDVMEHNRDALLISPGVKTLAEALLRLVSDASLRTALGKNFQQKVVSEHTWRKMAQRILSSIQ